jgi:signal transduction histidine kinase
MIALRALIDSGLHYARNHFERRCIHITNQISLILIGFSLILLVTYYAWYGWSFTTIMIPIAAVCFFLPIALNHYGFYNASRIFLCLFIPIATTAVSIQGKLLSFVNQHVFDYFTFRFLILASCVFPFILFTLRERMFLIANAFAGLTILLLYDPLHNVFNVGYAQMAFTSLNVSSYYYANIVIFLTYCIMVGAVIFLKWISEKNEDENALLISDLNKVNIDLVGKNAEVAEQSMELMAQSEVLNAQQQNLIEAYGEIEKHKNQLYSENKNLSAELIEKNKDLTEANSELIKLNNELRQFSYTVSHNLRGPVASLLGLNSLIEWDKLDENNTKVINHIKLSVLHLDTIIHDLSKIIDIRHDIFKIRQKINIEKEIKEITRVFKREIENYNIKIHYDFSNDLNVYSIKPMVHSILYNLINNSIKYKSTERQCEIVIKAYEDDEHFIISVTDNGLGIDLVRFNHNIFKLYQRFHYSTEGKGLGLYLVKLQCEALGGHIDVKSEVNKSTTFTAYLRKPENIQMQILYDEPYARIFYDAKMNAAGVQWHGPISSEQYRRVFNKCLEFLISYNTPNWVSDITDQGPIDLEDQHWMFQHILRPAAKVGLKRIAAIRPDADEPHLIEYLNGLKAEIAKLNIDQAYFTTFNSAFDWMMAENERASH